MSNIPGYFSTVFGQSPFKDLQAHVAMCVAAVRELNILLPKANAADWVAVEASYDRLSSLENEADELKRKIRTHLPKGIFLPVARSDVLDLLGCQDELANTARDIAGLILGRKAQFPSELQDSVLELVEGSVTTCGAAHEIIDRLDELIDSAFKGPQARLVVSMIEEVERLEHETDLLVMRIRKEFSEIEDQHPPVQVMFLYRILDLIAELADGAERVGHRVQLMLAK